jgi:hypothetical protein
MAFPGFAGAQSRQVPPLKEAIGLDGSELGDIAVGENKGEKKGEDERKFEKRRKRSVVSLVNFMLGGNRKLLATLGKNCFESWA